MRCHLPTRRARAGLAVIVLGLLAASCGYGRTNPAAEVTDVSARLSGLAQSTTTGSTTWWFEYGTTTAYGTSTPNGTVQITSPTNGVAVASTVRGLAEATTYHQRLCVRGSDGLGTCGSDQVFTTTAERDSVTGQGIVFSEPTLGFAIGGGGEVRSDPGGANPTGTFTTYPGTAYFRLADTGPATCLRVEGNRATIGFTSDLSVYDPSFDPIQVLAFVEDNGPTGDRFGLTTGPAPGAPCPAPTASSFPDFFVGGFPVPPVLASGDFVVHDHTPAG